MVNKKRLLKDRIAELLMAILTISSLLLVVAMAVGLYMKSAPILQEHSLWDLLTEGEWRPMSNKFGFFPFLMGTLDVSLLALSIAIPISLLMAIYLTEYAHTAMKRYIFPLLDILAGLPSVIYGVWGMLVIVPWVADVIAPSLNKNSSGYTVLATGVVLGVTVIPLLVSLFIEIFSSVGRYTLADNQGCRATQNGSWCDCCHCAGCQSHPWRDHRSHHGMRQLSHRARIAP